MTTLSVVQNHREYDRRIAAVNANIMRILQDVQASARSTIIDIYDVVGGEVITDQGIVLTPAQMLLVNNRLKKLSGTVSSTYKKKDDYIRRAVEAEYNVAWYEHMYDLTTLTNEAVFFNPSKAVRERAYTNQLNILNNSNELRLRRRQDSSALVDTIRRSISQNMTLTETTRSVDVLLGYRLVDGKLSPLAIRKMESGELVKRGGQIYQSQRIARTEMSRMRSIAAVDAMQKQRSAGYDVRLQKISTIDTRTRPQSAQMDGQVSNKLGQFRYPDGRLYYPGSQPGKWAINDRGTFVEWIEDIPDEKERTIRTPDGEVLTGPYMTFKEYAQAYELKTNVFKQAYNF